MVSLVVLFISLFIFSTNLLKYKIIAKPDDITAKVQGFYAEPKNSLDVVNIGSSHVYCGINPSILWDDYGITSYDFSSSGQTLWLSYSYIKEALKYQSPKVVVLDVYCARFEGEYESEGINRRNLDFLKFSKNKIEAIENSVPKEERLYYYINFMKYHNNWKNINKSSFQMWGDEKNPYKGYSVTFENKLKNISGNPNISNIKEQSPIPTKSLEYLNKIIQLSKEKGFKLVLIDTPYLLTENDQKVYNSVAEIAKKNDIPFINYNLLYNEIGFDSRTDMLDDGHNNSLGAEKVTKYLGEYLKKNYNFDDKRSNTEYKYWDADAEYYKREKEAHFLSQETDIYKYFDKINDSRYIKIISARDEASNRIDDELVNKFHELGLNKDLKGKFRWSYLSIIDGNKVIYEDCSETPLSSEVNIDKVNIRSTSKGMGFGDMSSIKIDGIENSCNSRGLNIVVYDKVLGRVIDSVCFDTYDKLQISRK
jgi:hypothetical protein